MKIDTVEVTEYPDGTWLVVNRFGDNQKVRVSANTGLSNQEKSMCVMEYLRGNGTFPPEGTFRVDRSGDVVWEREYQSLAGGNA